MVHVSADVRNWLKADGHDVFLDYDRQDGIESGDLWEERLYERLRGADAVVCLVTSDYVMSQYISYHDAQAREQVCRILREIDATGGAGWPDDRSPFPGLRAFDVDMNRAFFGRRREVDDLVRLLRSLTERGEGQIVVVVGPPGVGNPHWYARACCPLWPASRAGRP